MFEILDAQGHVVDTATTLPQAQNVVSFLTRTNRSAAPFNCRVKA